MTGLAVLQGPLPLLAALLAPWLALVLFPVLPRRAAAVLLPLAPLPALVLTLLPTSGAMPGLSAGIGGITFALDATGRVFLLPAAVVWAIAGWHAVTGRQPPGLRGSFAVPWFLALAGSLTLILAQDLLTYYTAMAVMTFASYGLIIHRRSPTARGAGRLYLAMMMVGEAAMFTGVATVMTTTEPGTTPGFQDVGDAPWAALALLGIGFATKLGVLGLHAWLPRAHPVAPAAASAVLSGVMIKAGLLGWWRVTEPAPATYPDLGLALVIIGLAAAFYGVLRGLYRSDAKTILAWSSVSQMGLVTMLAGTTQLAAEVTPAAWTGLAVFVVHHGLNKGALFLGADLNTAPDRNGDTAGWLLLWPPALALTGAPVTSGALAKAAATDALAPLPIVDWITALLYLSTMATTLLMLRLLWCTRPMALSLPRFAPRERFLPAATLMALAAALPWLLFHEAPAATAALTGGGIWGATWPVLLATAGAMAGYHWYRHRPRERWQWPTPATSWPAVREWANRQLVRMTTRERQLQQWTTIGRLLLAVVVLLAAAILPASMH